jgi:phosphoserine phosphatase
MHFAFDLDGTITREELLPRIARDLGIEAEMAELTRLTMQGAIPFAHSFRERVRMLSAVGVARVRTIVEGVGVHPAIAAFIADHPGQCTIVTGNLDVWVGSLCDRLGAALIASEASVDRDRITGITRIVDKAEAARSLPHPLVAVGDGHNDLGMLEAAEIAIAYGGVHAPAPALAAVATHAIHDGDALCRLLRQL